MKKTISFLLLLVMLLLLAACGQITPTERPENMPAAEPSVKPVPTAEPESEPETEAMTVEEQKQFIEGLKDTWLPEDWAYSGNWYTITDLDHNGRLEVLCASLQGTGLYTYMTAWEVSEDYTSLNPVSYELEEGESGPDVIIDTADCYYDASTGLYHYIILDTLRLGADSHQTTKYALTMENGAIRLKALASWREEYSYEGKALIEYMDGEGNYIDEDQYNAAADMVYAGMEKAVASFIWTNNGPAPAEAPNIVLAADLFNGSGFTHRQCDSTGVYDFTPVKSEGVEWQVYILEEEFTDAERFIPQAYECSLTGSGSIGIKEGQWIYVYCPCNAWTTEEAPAGCAFSWSIDPFTPYEETAAATASETTDGGDGPDVVITKNPTGEVIPVGGNNWFIAHADYADKLTWKFYDTSKVLRSIDEAMAMNPGLDLKALEQDTLAVSNVPASFNGWSVVAYFEGNGKAATTDPAPIFVGDYITTYSAVFNSYRNSDNADTVYTSLDEVFSGIPSANISGVGVIDRMEDSLGYYMADLNRDGIPEMIIGSRNEHSGGLIVDMFTVAGGQVKRVLASSERCRYMLRADGYVTVTGSNGADSTGDYLLAMNTKGGMSLVEGVEINGENYYRVKDTDFDNSNDTRINQSEYQSVVKSIHEGEFGFAMKQLG